MIVLYVCGMTVRERIWSCFKQSDVFFDLPSALQKDL